MQAIVKLSHAIIEKLNITNNKDGPGREIVGTKGPVFATAIVAGVMAAKRTSELIPFCHQVPLDKCDIDIELISSDVTSDAKSSNDSRSGRIKIDCFVSTSGKTGVEMEAIIGASMAAICIYDMLKALSHDIEIIDTYLVSKSGGKSTYQRQS